MNEKEKVVIKMKSIQQADDMTMALDFIKSAILLNCDEGNASIDNHVLTKTETKAIIGRLLSKALTILGDYEFIDLLRSFNADEQNNNHDAHTKLLMELIDN